MRSQMIEMQWTENETMWVNEHFWGMISCLDERDCDTSSRISFDVFRYFFD